MLFIDAENITEEMLAAGHDSFTDSFEYEYNAVVGQKALVFSVFKAMVDAAPKFPYATPPLKQEDHSQSPQVLGVGLPLPNARKE